MAANPLVAKVFGVLWRWYMGNVNVYDGGFRGCFAAVIDIFSTVNGINNHFIKHAKGAKL